MYGNGRPSPTASGVSTGKIWRRKRSWSAARSLVLDRRRARRCGCRARRAPGAGRARGSAAARARAARRRSRMPSMVCEACGRRAAARDAGVDLVVQAGHADHVELVEVRRPDGGELHPLEQRHPRVLGELQHAVVEVHPGQLAVDEQGGIGSSQLEGDGRCRRLDGADRTWAVPCCGWCSMVTMSPCRQGGFRVGDGDGRRREFARLRARSASAYSRRARNPVRPSSVHWRRKRRGAAPRAPRARLRTRAGRATRRRVGVAGQRRVEIARVVARTRAQRLDLRRLLGGR